jgi:hypothetical protein
VRASYASRDWLGLVISARSGMGQINMGRRLYWAGPRGLWSKSIEVPPIASGHRPPDFSTESRNIFGRLKGSAVRFVFLPRLR